MSTKGVAVVDRYSRVSHNGHCNGHSKQVWGLGTGQVAASWQARNWSACLRSTGAKTKRGLFVLVWLDLTSSLRESISKSITAYVVAESSVARSLGQLNLCVCRRSSRYRFPRLPVKAATMSFIARRGLSTLIPPKVRCPEGPDIGPLDLLIRDE